MNETLWYYVDRAQQRVGPVTAADVAPAWRAGEATDETLVWHEGEVEWAPLWGFLFFAEVPQATTAAGAALIVGAGVFALNTAGRTRREPAEA